jgi:hypothetical protein
MVMIFAIVSIAIPVATMGVYRAWIVAPPLATGALAKQNTHFLCIQKQNFAAA